jgi:F0F1-type ATP synthase membrane subunit b/b'
MNFSPIINQIFGDFDTLISSLKRPDVVTVLCDPCRAFMNKYFERVPTPEELRAIAETARKAAQKLTQQADAIKAKEVAAAKKVAEQKILDAQAEVNRLKKEEAAAIKAEKQRLKSAANSRKGDGSGSGGSGRTPRKTKAQLQIIAAEAAAAALELLAAGTLNSTANAATIATDTSMNIDVAAITLATVVNGAPTV